MIKQNNNQAIKQEKNEYIIQTTNNIKSLSSFFSFVKFIYKDKYLLPRRKIINFSIFDFSLVEDQNIYEKDNDKEKDNENINIFMNNINFEHEFINKFYSNYSNNKLYELILMSNCYTILLNNIINSTVTKLTSKDFFCLVCLICSDFPKKIYENINILYNLSENKEIDSEANIILLDYFCYFIVMYFNYDFIMDILKRFNINLNKENKENEYSIINMTLN